MKKQDQLFRLINTLTKSEKRYFKLYTQMQSGSENYIMLFDAIDKMKVYDESKIRKKFKGKTFLNQLAVMKNYLFNVIIKSLKNFESGKAIHHSKNYESFEEAILLRDRNLPNISEKYLNKIRKKLQTENDGQVAFRLAKLDWEAALKKEPSTMVTESAKCMERIFEALDSQDHYFSIFQLWSKFILIYLQFCDSNKLEDKAQATEILAQYRKLNGCTNPTIQAIELGKALETGLNIVLDDGKQNEAALKNFQLYFQKAREAAVKTA